MSMCLNSDYVLLDPIFTKEVKCPDCGQPVTVKQRSSCEDPAGTCPNCGSCVVIMVRDVLEVRDGVRGIYFKTDILSIRPLGSEVTTQL